MRFGATLFSDEPIVLSKHGLLSDGLMVRPRPGILVVGTIYSNLWIYNHPAAQDCILQEIKELGKLGDQIPIPTSHGHLRQIHQRVVVQVLSHRVVANDVIPRIVFNSVYPVSLKSRCIKNRPSYTQHHATTSS